MNKRKILILHPDYAVHKKYAQDPAVELLFDAKKFNALASSIKDDFTVYIDDMSRLFYKSIDWWVTPLSTRDTIGAFYFQTICYAVYAKRLLETTEVTEIICFSHQLRKTMGKITGSCRQTKVYVDNIVKTSMGIKGLLRSFSRTNSIFAILMMNCYFTLNFLMDAAKKHRAAKKSRMKGHRQFEVDGTWLIDVFVFRSSFEDNRFQSRHYKRMPYLVRGEWAYMANFIDVTDYYETFRVMRNNKPVFLIMKIILNLSIISGQ